MTNITITYPANNSLHPEQSGSWPDYTIHQIVSPAILFQTRANEKTYTSPTAIPALRNRDAILEGRPGPAFLVGRDYGVAGTAVAVVCEDGVGPFGAVEGVGLL